jgi:cyclic beta-1,2-glucan synthetase
MAGDVYTQPPFVGRGGWSWYTGAAAWMHRAAVESILGLHITASDLRFVPCLPAAWPRAEITLRRDGRVLHFVLQRGSEAEVLAAHAAVKAQLLRVGQTLDWPALVGERWFVLAV